MLLHENTRLTSVKKIYAIYASGSDLCYGRVFRPLTVMRCALIEIWE